MKRTVLSAMAAGVLVLSACGSGSESSDAPDPTADVGDETASIEQYAGEVAALKSDLAEWQGDWEDKTCSSLAAQDDPLCNAQVLIGRMVATAHSSSLSAMSKETAPGFIGHPHPEIASLYEETLAAAETADAAGDEWADLDCPGDDGCVGSTFQLVNSLGDLASAYEKWSPHL